jgi:nucleoside-diphosphate-sugar epimerase
VPEGVVLLKGDIRERQAVENALSGHKFDVVTQFIGYLPEHVEADIDIFSGRTGQYIFISSASVYHKPPSHYIITESTPAYNPFWEYSQKKIACENLLQRAYREKGFPFTIVRPSHTYNDGWLLSSFGSSDYTVAHRMLNGREIVVHGDGQSLWVVTHADDFARAFVGLFGNRRAVGETFHITSEEVLTWDQIHLTLADALGVEPKIVHISSDFIASVAPKRGGGLCGDKAYSVVFDNSKIKRFVPGFRAVIPYHEGIRRSLAWYEAHPELKVSNPQVEQEIETVLSAWRRRGRQ